MYQKAEIMGKKLDLNQKVDYNKILITLGNTSMLMSFVWIPTFDQFFIFAKTCTVPEL